MSNNPNYVMTKAEHEARRTAQALYDLNISVNQEVAKILQTALDALNAIHSEHCDDVMILAYEYDLEGIIAGIEDYMPKMDSAPRLNGLSDWCDKRAENAANSV
jgi:hypothetical protein